VRGSRRLVDSELVSLMSFVEVVLLDWKQTRKHHGVCVVKQPAAYADGRREIALHSHNTSRKGNSTSVGDTQIRGRQQ
jgi:hypothetical protein